MRAIEQRIVLIRSNIELIGRSQRPEALATYIQGLNRLSRVHLKHDDAVENAIKWFEILALDSVYDIRHAEPENIDDEIAKTKARLKSALGIIEEKLWKLDALVHSDASTDMPTTDHQQEEDRVL